jgi:hypothetical protein
MGGGGGTAVGQWAKMTKREGGEEGVVGPGVGEAERAVKEAWNVAVALVKLLRDRVAGGGGDEAQPGTRINT